MYLYEFLRGHYTFEIMSRPRLSNCLHAHTDIHIQNYECKHSKSNILNIEN